jgi:hypothetical protein
MKAYWGVEVYLHAFLTSELDGGKWSASRPGHFTFRERDPGTHWIGGWVGPRAVLDAVMKRKIPRMSERTRLNYLNKLNQVPTEIYGPNGDGITETLMNYVTFTNVAETFHRRR